MTPLPHPDPSALPLHFTEFHRGWGPTYIEATQLCFSSTTSSLSSYYVVKCCYMCLFAEDFFSPSQTVLPLWEHRLSSFSPLSPSLPFNYDCTVMSVVVVLCYYSNKFSKKSSQKVFFYKWQKNLNLISGDMLECHKAIRQWAGSSERPIGGLQKDEFQTPERYITVCISLDSI